MNDNFGETKTRVSSWVFTAWGAVLGATLVFTIYTINGKREEALLRDSSNLPEVPAVKIDREEPQGKSVEPKSTESQVGADTEATSSQPTQTEKTYTQDELNKVFEMDKKSKDTKLYHSQKLGVGFTYETKFRSSPNNLNLQVKEEGNKIGLYENGEKEPMQYIQIFEKDNVEKTLEESVRAKFLVSADPQRCFVEKITKGSFDQSLYTEARITYDAKSAEGKNSPWENISKICGKGSEGYVETTGGARFFEDKSNTSVFMFVGVGNGLSVSSGLPNGTDGYQKNWYTSVRVLK